MTHTEIVWQILSALAVILTVLAAHLRAARARDKNHAATVETIVQAQAGKDAAEPQAAPKP